MDFYIIEGLNDFHRNYVQFMSRRNGVVKMAVTIYDVAKLAHVSVTTISKILNHKDYDISDETRQRVLNVIKEVNFTPNELARSLVTKRTNVLGLLIPDISNLYFADMARGVEDGANRLGYNVILCNTDENQKKEQEYLEILKGRGTDGVIIVPIAGSDTVFSSDFNFEKPYVILDRVYDNTENNLFQVRFDNVKGGYLATKYLIEKGHKRIGIISGPENDGTTKDRLKGYKLALEESHIALDDSIVFYGNYKFDSGVTGADNLIRKDITSVFAFNDLMASGAYKAITAHGLKIPRDISVIGYDNVYLSEMLDPALTTISQPKYEMGKVAATMLIKLLKKNQQETEAAFAPTLIERQSVRAL